MVKLPGYRVVLARAIAGMSVTRARVRLARPARVLVGVALKPKVISPPIAG